MPNPLPSTDGLKSQARRLRAALYDGGRMISHSTALEMVARQHGFRDWNAISAHGRLHNAPPRSGLGVGIGCMVGGEYLGHPFRGQLIAVQRLSGGNRYRVTIVFDEPIDVVTFDSFSAFRRRVSCTIDSEGVSPRQRSGGVPHLRLFLPSVD